MDLQRIHHFVTGVADLDRAIEWYQDILGFSVERRFEFADLGTRIAHVTSGQIRIELLERDGSTSGPDVDRDAFDALLVRGAKHVGIAVEDVDAVAEELRAKGVDLVQEPTVVEPAGVKNCWCRDPDGTLIEFAQPLSAPPAA